MLWTVAVDRMLDRLIAREGGYVNHPEDPGGETKYGISKRAYPDLDIKSLTIDDAKRIYYRDYFTRFSLHELRHEQTVEWVLDWVVNSGPGAIGRLQRELGLIRDYVVGPQTIKALNEMDDPKNILRWRLKFFTEIPPKHPFLRGWVNRLLELGL